MKGIFQQYNFDFTSERVGNVIENVKPEMVVFMGALDESNLEVFGQVEAIKYISGLVGIVTASKAAGVEKFAYISSLDVFDGNDEELISEETKVIPIAIKNKVFLQGEQLCDFYNEKDVFEVVSIRFPEMYGTFGSDYVKNNIVEKFIKSGYLNQKINVKTKSHLLIDINDGVEAFYDILFKMEVSENNIYHIPGIRYTENETANLVTGKLPNSIEVVSEENESFKLHEFKAGRLEESGFFLRKKLEQSIEEICRVISEEKNHTEKVKRRAERKNKWIFSIIENLVLFAIAYFLTLLTDGKWIGEVVNFYIIYVVIIAVTHGMSQALLASMLSIFGNITHIISKEGVQGIVGNLEPYVWILQLLIIGALVAYMRDKYKVGLRDAKEDIKYLNEELQEINEINESNVYIKDIYEKRLISYKNSLSRLYDVTTALDFLEPQKVIFQATTVISKLMECNDIAIYIGNGKSKYYRLAAATSAHSKQLGKSFALEEKTDIFQALLEKDIYRNKGLVEKMPIMAGATYNNNMITAIIMVWTDSLEGSTMYQINLLSILCRLIERSILRAYDFMEALADESYYTNSSIMKADAFIKQFEIYKEGKEQGLLDYSVLNLVLSENKKAETKLASKLIRDTDYIGVVGRKVKILLSSTNSDETNAVIKRFLDNKLNVELET